MCIRPFQAEKASNTIHLQIQLDVYQEVIFTCHHLKNSVVFAVNTTPVAIHASFRYGTSLYLDS